MPLSTDADTGQAHARLAVAGVVFAGVLLWHWLAGGRWGVPPGALWAATLYLLGAVSLVLLVRARPVSRHPSRLWGLAADVAAVSFAVYFAGEASPLLAGLYVALAAVYGVRFGLGYLLIAAAAGTVGAAVALAFSGFLGAHAGLGAAFLALTPVIALYLGRALQSARPLPPTARPTERSAAPDRRPGEVARATPPADAPPGATQHVMVLAGQGLAADLGAAFQGWGMAVEHVHSVPRLLASLILAAERHLRCEAVIIERGRLDMAPEHFLVALREERAIARVPVVLLDAHGIPATDEALLRAGYSAVLRVPVNKALLFNAVAASRDQPLAGNTLSFARYLHQRSATTQGRILVVDDSPITRSVIKGVLERAEYAVDLAGDGDQALSVLRRDPPGVDLVLLDLQMPGRGGLEVLNRYRSMAVDTRVPILVLTSDATPSVRSVCLQAGASGFLEKPVEPLTLLEGIDRLLRPTARPARRTVAELAGGERPGPHTRPRLDEVTLDSLARLGRDPGFVPGLVDGFAREGGRLLECIRVALVQGDHGAFVDAVQALKGSAGDLGARPVAQLCERVQEVPAERLGSPRVLLLVEALARTFEATCVDLTEYLQRRRDAVR